MYIPQYLLEPLKKIKFPHKAVIICGPHRTGKTTLLNKILEDQNEYLLVNGSDIHTQRQLSTQSIAQLQAFVGEHKLLAIDDAQKINQIGLSLRLILEYCPEVQIVAACSSTFDLTPHLCDPLSEKKISAMLFPLSQMEILSLEDSAQTFANLESRLIFGSYPEVVLQNFHTQIKEYLNDIILSHLFKDIMELTDVRRSKKIMELLQVLAFQIGNEISLSEISKQLDLNKGTIEKYLDMLEKSFVIIKVTGLNRGANKEISKKSRYYFYDNGVRNAIINHFNPLSLRNDKEALWQNYIVMERIKKLSYQQIFSRNYFWRAYSDQKIDWVEERESGLYGYTIKWQNMKTKVPTEWRRAYPQSEFSIIHPNNYLDFII